MKLIMINKEDRKLDNKKLIGIIIFIILIVIISGVYFIGNSTGGISSGIGKGSGKGSLYDLDRRNITDNMTVPGYTTVYVAAGGGKEKFLEDPEINQILLDKYKLNVVYDDWSNGKLVLWPTIREAIGRGNKSITNGKELTVTSQGVTPYDAIFTSDLRYYNYYKLPADKLKGEADRQRVQGGSLTLNTPIVVYSWDIYADALIKEGIVTLRNGTYYITDMDKLLSYMEAKKKWNEIGVDGISSFIDIKSVDPVTSSPGATYYGLLLSIFCNKNTLGMTDENIIQNLPELREYYQKAGSLLQTPSDLFQKFLFQGSEPLIVDYEKSIVDLANSEPGNFEPIKDKIRVLYPEPTMYNSHCYEYFTDAGKLLFDAYNDPDIKKIAWSKYGFRMGVSIDMEEINKLGIGISQNISNTVDGLRMDTYDKLVAYLAEKDDEKAYNILHDIEEQ